MSLGWSTFVLVLVIVNVAGCAWLIRWSGRMAVGEGETTGHVWDGDLIEGNNPMPRWWLGLFWITIAGGILLMIAYPSFGDFSLLGWTQVQQYDQEIASGEEQYGKVFAAFATTPLEELAHDDAALAAGRNLFVNNCAACHGSDARGARGYPNLTDGEWNWGSKPEDISNTIGRGRTGMMPPFGAALPEDTRRELVAFVESLAGREVDDATATAGGQHFALYCAACHGPGGEGNPLLGAPHLANELWLHGTGRETIFDVITNGRTSTMPPHEALLGPDRVHVLAAYVLSLAQRPQEVARAP
jgi:cytochrome c oxidase cbb3-type subunit III